MWAAFLFFIQVQISAPRSTISAEIYRAFSRSLQANARIFAQIEPWSLSSTHFPLIIQPFDAICPGRKRGQVRQSALPELYWKSKLKLSLWHHLWMYLILLSMTITLLVQFFFTIELQVKVNLFVNFKIIILLITWKNGSTLVFQ
jgi:hypothetical protein